MPNAILNLDERVEVVILALGVLAGIPAAYYTGETGDSVPLMAVCIALGTFIAVTSVE